jgi:methylphosphotriester-DNA--protein-cysteine methyltransferase
MLGQMTIVCRAFAQSFGIPSHRYQVKRRIEKANIMLAARKAVTQIGVTLACSSTRSFEEAFRKSTGPTTSSYQRSLSVERLDFRDALADEKHSRPNSRRGLK